MTPNDESLLSAKIDLTVDDSTVQPSLDNAEKKVKNFAESTEKEASKASRVAAQVAGSAAKDVAQGASLADAAMNTVIRSVAKLGAAFPVMAAVGVVAFGAIFAKIRSEKKEAEELNRKLLELSETVKRFGEAAKEGFSHLKVPDTTTAVIARAIGAARAEFEEAIKQGADPETLRFMKANVQKLEKELHDQRLNEQQQRADEARELDRQANETTEKARRERAEREKAERQQTQDALDEAREAAIEHGRRMLEIERQIATTRVNGWIDSRREAEAMMARQRSGFGLSDAAGTNEAGLRRLQNQVRALQGSIPGP